MDIEIPEYIAWCIIIVYLSVIVRMFVKSYYDHRKYLEFSKHFPDTIEERIHQLEFSRNTYYKICIAECIVRDLDSTEEELYAVFHHACIPNSDVDLRALRILEKRSQRYSVYMKISLLMQKVPFSIKTKYFKKNQKRILEKQPLSS